MRLTLTEEREAEIRKADGLLPLVLVDESCGVDWGFPSAVAHRRSLLAEVDALRAQLADVSQRFEEKLREPIPALRIVTCESMPRGVVAMVNRDTGERVVQRVTIQDDDGEI